MARLGRTYGHHLVYRATYALPAAASAPAATGPTVIGQVVSTTSGAWTGDAPSFGYQWQDSPDGSTGWANIGGANSSTYTVGAGENTRYLRSVVTDTTFGGIASAVSNVIGPVAATVANAYRILARRHHHP